jgi:Helix-turn-helix domain
VSGARLLTVGETAVYLRGEDTAAHRDLVRRMIADGKLEARRERGRWMVPVACIEAYLAPRGLQAPGGPQFPREVKVGRRSRRAA